MSQKSSHAKNKKLYNEFSYMEFNYAVHLLSVRPSKARLINDSQENF